MKKSTLIVIGLVMFLCAPLAIAGTGAAHRNAPDTVDLGLIAMSRHDFEQMKALVAGEAPSDSRPAPRSVSMETVGQVEMTADEAATLRQMVAGNYTGPENAVSSRAVANIQLGLISMPRADYDTLQDMVRGYRMNWGQVVAGTSSVEAPSAGQ